MLTRRNAMLAGTGLILAPMRLLFGFGSKDFWNSKEPSDWSDKEVTKLLTQSPWAKEANVDSHMGPQSSSSRGNRGAGMGGGTGSMGNGGAGIGGGVGGMNRGTMGDGSVGGGSMGGGEMGGGSISGIRINVVWESALPVRLARKANVETEASYYILSVSGMPPRRDASQYAADETEGQAKEYLKVHTTLQARGKDPISPEKIDIAESVAGRAVVCYFPKSPAITAEDKEVTFNSQVRQMQIHVKFELKEMQYKNQLAL